MFHMLTSRNWEPLASVKTEDMVEDVLAMETGNHVLEAFNLPYDSFVDNVVFSGIIDRVGKYQLSMQKVCAYRPFAQSMPPMLREEAFHLASGVVPMRRWLESAAQGDPLITTDQIQRSLNKWLPRGLEMFGDERGGDTNIRLGFKDLKNRDAQTRYYVELQKLVRDLNQRFLKARYPAKTPEALDAIYDALVKDRGVVEGTRWEELLQLPHRDFFRRRGEPAYRMVDVEGKPIADVEEYVRYLATVLPQAYCASKDMADYAALIRQVAKGEVTIVEEQKGSLIDRAWENVLNALRSFAVPEEPTPGTTA
jgi:hypothetical protein